MAGPRSLTPVPLGPRGVAPRKYRWTPSVVSNVEPSICGRTRKSVSPVAAKLMPWIDSTFSPARSALLDGVRSKSSKTTPADAGRFDVAVEFHASGSGALVLPATSSPLRYATNASSYFMRSVSTSNNVGSVTVNGIRTYADERFPIAGPMSVWMSGVKSAPVGGGVVVDRYTSVL